MVKKLFFLLIVFVFNVSLAAAYCSKEETLKFVEAGYSKHDIDRICRERDHHPQPQHKRSLYGTWRGSYGYERHSRRPDVPFKLVVTRHEHDHFSGYTKEPQTFGSHRSEYLSAEVNGNIDRENRVEFVKRYTGRGGVHHKVIYKGVLHKGNIEGRWFIPGGGGSGTFTLYHER